MWYCIGGAENSRDFPEILKICPSGSEITTMDAEFRKKISGETDVIRLKSHSSDRLDP